MGKSKIIPIVIEEFGRRGWEFFGAWDRKNMGVPNNANLAAFRKVFIDSTRRGGCNEHLGLRNTGNLRARRQKDDAILATFIAPTFEVV